MTGIDVDLSCDRCGARHHSADTVEEAVLNCTQSATIRWICDECGNVVEVERDVEEL